MNASKSKTALIVGAGVGGLCTAARLAKLGYTVTLLEKNAQVGGRANRIVKDGYTFDTGPTLLMMTEVLHDTFAFCGQKLADYAQLIQLEPNYQVLWPDGKKIEVSSNLARFNAELARFDEQAPEQFYRYFADVAHMYRLARSHFIDKNFDRLRDFVSPRHGLHIARRGGLRKLYSFVSSYFADEHLRQLFSFQSMYLGVSPYDAPAVYSTISYMETALGIWYPKGGMYALVQGLAQLAKDLGVTIRTNSAVAEITVENGRACGVELEGGEKLRADIVIANADLLYSYHNLIAENQRPSMTNQKLAGYTLAGSALLFYMGVKHPLDGLLHHNVFLSKDFRRNLDEVFHDQTIPTDPAFYAYVPTKTDPSLAPKGRQVLYLLVPVPNLQTKGDWPKETARIRNQVLARLKAELGYDVAAHIEVETQFGPQDFAEQYNLVNGSAFGISHTFFQSGYFRPHNKSHDIDSLYFVGASTYPGGGIPMVSLSAKLVVERIEHDATQH